MATISFFPNEAGMYELAYGARSEKRLFAKSSPGSAAAGAAKMAVNAIRAVHALILEVIAYVGSGCQLDAWA